MGGEDLAGHRTVPMQLRLADLDGPPEDAAEILNRLLQGVLLVDADSRVRFANRAAESVLRAGRGLLLGRDGLRAETPSETRLLRWFIAERAKLSRESGGAASRLRLTREHSQPLAVLVVSHRPQFGWIDFARPRAILFVTDPETAVAVRCDTLREDFGLTLAEAAVAVEIVEGDGLQAAAARLRISLATARTHLAHVFDKTDTRRQAELVSLLLRSRPGVRED